MTLSDPLLKELKGHIAKLVLRGSPPYGDDNETVFLLCHCIEAIFLKGLIRHDGFTPWRTDTFSWFYQLIRKYHRTVPLSFKLGFEEVLSDTKTRTQTGKTRLLLRTCLKRRTLHVPLQFHIENEDYSDPSLRVNYSPQGSILGHEILSQIFLSLILQLSHYEFTFDLHNSSFLDESWQIPQLIRTEFVPCERLGLTLGFPMGFAVIADIIEHSLAAELGDAIAVGDIMDEFNGACVRNFYGPKIESLFRKNRLKPFTITFIKATDQKGQLYLPAIKLYRILGLDPEKLTFSKLPMIDHKDQPIDLEVNLDDDNNIDVERSTRSNELFQSSNFPPESQLQLSSPAKTRTSNLIQGLESANAPSETHLESISSKEKKSSINPTSYCDILSSLSTASPEKFPILDDGVFEKLVDIDLSPPLLTSSWSEFPEEIININLPEPDSNIQEELNEQQQKVGVVESEEEERKGSIRPVPPPTYPAYYDDSNPCMV